MTKEQFQPIQPEKELAKPSEEVPEKEEEKGPEIIWSPEAEERGLGLASQIGELKKELNLAEEQGDFEKGKEILEKLEPLIAELEEIAEKEAKKGIKYEFTPEETRKSIEEIIKEENLDIEFEIGENNEVRFKEAKEKIDQIIKIITHPNNKVNNIDLWDNDLGPEGAKSIAEALSNPNNKVNNIDLGYNKLGPEGAKSIAEALSNPNNKVNNINLWDNKLGPEDQDRIYKQIKKARPDIELGI